MTTSYWNTFYKKKFIIEPSSFAKFVLKKFIKTKKLSLIDVGCGNGRDSFFFTKKKLNVLGVDNSKTAIISNNKNLKIKNLKFNLLSIESKKFHKIGKFDIIYSRFFLHTINKDQEVKFIKALKSLSILNKTLIMLEFRTTKDKMMQKGKKISKNENFTDHYRRYINAEKFNNKIKKMGHFKIIYFIEKKGLSNHKNDNPTLARVIMKRTTKI